MEKKLYLKWKLPEPVITERWTDKYAEARKTDREVNRDIVKRREKVYEKDIDRGG